MAFHMSKTTFSSNIFCAILLAIMTSSQLNYAQLVVDAGLGERPDLDANASDSFVDVQAVSGGAADLPCDITPRQTTDAVILVVWYRGDTPIYSWDARSGALSSSSAGGEGGSHWSAESGERIRWSALGARLSLRPTHPGDRGEYRCRADFRASPTRNTRVRLQIIEAPGIPRIIDESGREIKGRAGPYREGDSPQLTCTVSGGHPPATVRWYRGGRALEGTGSGAGVLRLSPLRRTDLLAPLICQASNSPLLPPSTAKVLLDMHLPPTEIEIVEREPLSAGREQQISCRAKGARPAPKMFWKLSGEKLEGEQQDDELDAQDDTEEGNESFRENNISTNTVKVIAKANQHGQRLICRAEHQLLSDPLEAQLTLNVLFAPTVVLNLGASLNPNDIEEGDDVYFECKVHANPPPYKLLWEHNGRPLVHDPKSGIMVQNGNLALRTVTRLAAGTYSCSASNVEGDAKSDVVTLQIMYKPVCSMTVRKTYGVAKQEKAQVVCEVESVPPPDAFAWTLNSTTRTLEVSPERYTWTSSPPKSILTFTPLTEGDYGTALCWASNLVGKQSVPCAITLLPAAKPLPPSNCSIVNQTTAALEIICDPGYDGGLQQWFQLEVFERPAELLLANVSAKRPSFLVGGLAAGRSLKLNIYAANSRGRSAPILLDAYTLELAEKITSRESSLEAGALIGAAAGAIGGIILILLLALAAIKLRRRRSSTLNYAGSVKDSRTPRVELIRSEIYDDRNPDVVPFNKAPDHKITIGDQGLENVIHTPTNSAAGTLVNSLNNEGVQDAIVGGPPRPPPYSRIPPQLTHTLPVGRAGREVVTTRAPLPAAQESDV